MVMKVSKLPVLKVTMDPEPTLRKSPDAAEPYWKRCDFPYLRRRLPEKSGFCMTFMHVPYPFFARPFCRGEREK